MAANLAAKNSSISDSIAKTISSLEKPVLQFTAIPDNIGKSFEALKGVEGMTENIKKVSSASTLANEFENVAKITGNRYV